MRNLKRKAGNAGYLHGSETRARLYILQDLGQMLVSFYSFYNRKVNESYSLKEQVIIVRIIESVIHELQNKPSLVDTIKVGCDLKCNSFRFVLPDKNPFSVNSRCSCLHQLDDYLLHFFASFGRQVTDKPYSFQEQMILKQIKKMFIHQLKGTDKYSRFKKKCPSHSTKITLEEKQELIYQRKDECLLRAVNGKITKINPRSKKYKALKEKKIQEINSLE